VNYGAHDVVRWVLGAAGWTLVVGTVGLSGITSMLLQSPFGVTCDSVSNVYVADSSNNRIQFFFAGQSNGTTGTAGSTSTLLNQPTSVVIDAQFNIYVVDYGNSRKQEFQHY
jgi:DNA-binding beta-propeller fold protein YncE